jgi:hypothetical protein
MNNFFKSLWNETSGTYVAASEIATAGGRKTASTQDRVHARGQKNA